jgi:hypothetical protein
MTSPATTSIPESRHGVNENCVNVSGPGREVREPDAAPTWGAGRITGRNTPLPHPGVREPPLDWHPRARHTCRSVLKEVDGCRAFCAQLVRVAECAHHDHEASTRSVEQVGPGSPRWLFKALWFTGHSLPALALGGGGRRAVEAGS